MNLSSFTVHFGWMNSIIYQFIELMNSIMSSSIIFPFISIVLECGIIYKVHLCRSSTHSMFIRATCPNLKEIRSRTSLCKKNKGQKQQKPCGKVTWHLKNQPAFDLFFKAAYVGTTDLHIQCFGGQVGSDQMTALYGIHPPKKNNYVQSFIADLW